MQTTSATASEARTVSAGNDTVNGDCLKCGSSYVRVIGEPLACPVCHKPLNLQNHVKRARGIKRGRLHQHPKRPTIDTLYAGVNGDWQTWLEVATEFEGKAISQDREDLRHNIIVRLADVSRTKTLTLPACYRVASYVVSEYWRNHFKLTAGLDCSNCSTKQRHVCRQDWLYENCPKAIRLESLDREITDAEGNITQFGDLVANDKAIDLEAWLDAKTFLKGCPQRLYEIAVKLEKGIQLNAKDRMYLSYVRKHEQIKLF